MVALKELTLKSFYIGMWWWSWKNWFLTVWHLVCCGGLERTNFQQFLLWECVVLLKELIFNSFYFGRVWWSRKNWFLTVAYLGKCSGLEITDFSQCVYWEGMVVLKELILNTFYIERVWWSWKNWFFSSAFGRLWWSWQKWFFTICMLAGYDGLERTYFLWFPLWEGMVVLTELILNSFHFGRVW